MDKMKVKCHRCGKEWEYTGGKIKLIGVYPQYVTCTKCRTSVKLVKEVKDESNSDESAV